MFSKVFGYVARVPESGFAWVYEEPSEVADPDESRSCKGWWLVQRAPLAGRVGVRTFNPDAENPALFRAFAALDPGDRDKMLEFANQFGELEIPRTIVTAKDPDPTLARSSRTGKLVGEKLDTWERQIEALVDAIFLRDRLSTGDVAALAQCMKWTPAKLGEDSGHWSVRVPLSFKPQFTPIYMPSGTGEGMPRYEVGWRDLSYSNASEGDDPRTVAIRWLDRSVTEHLAFDKVRFATDSQTNISSIQLITLILIELIWAQFARSITENTSYRTCKECGRIFEILPKHRGRKEFCDNACKLRDARKRRNRVAELKTAGRTPQQIATELDMELATVKKWFKAKPTPKSGKKGGQRNG